jgi:hypothetical protein
VGIAFFLVSYALGSILSLRASGSTDRLSASLIPDEYKRGRPLSLETAKKFLLSHGDDGKAAWDWLSSVDYEEPTPPKDTGNSEIPKGAESLRDYKDLWIYDEFPYPCWSLVRLGAYCPEEVFLFYWKYRKSILSQVGRSPHFLNYCKMAVYAGNGSGSSPLAAEIREAESNVRFLAGAFEALVISSAFLVGFVLYHGVPERLPLVLLPILAVGALVMPPGHMLGKPASASAGGISPARSALRRGIEWLFEECVRVFRAIRKLSGGSRCLLWAFRFVGLLACSCLVVPFRLIEALEQFLFTHQPDRFLWMAEPASLGLIVLAIAEFLLALGIVSQGRLRTRRHAEVAAVMDAFYLTCGTKQAGTVRPWKKRVGRPEANRRTP